MGYGVGDLGINLYFISAMTYLTYFYTDVFGLSAASVVSLMLVARIIDAVTDPLMGIIAERTRTRWGRLRPYLLFGAPVLGGFAVAIFTTPTGSADTKLLWAYVTYVGFGLAYTIVSVPYSALTASLTLDYDERTVLSTVRMAFAFAGGLAVSWGLPKMVGWFDSEAFGYRSVMIGFAVLATLLLWLTFWQTDERYQPPANQKLALADSVKAVFANPPLLTVFVIFTGGMLSFTLRQATTAYFFKYNVGRPDLIGDFFLVTLSVMFVGLLVTPRLTERVGKAKGIVFGALLTLVGLLGFYLTPNDAISTLFFWGCVISLGGTPIAVLGWAMIPDTVEYAQWRHGVRADGAIFAFASFFQKLAKAIGGAAVAGALAWAGYIANAEQTPQTLEAIRMMMTGVPAVIMLVLIVAALTYRLDERAHEQLVSELT